MSRIHLSLTTSNKNRNKETLEEVLEEIKKVEEVEYAEARLGIFDSARKRYYKYERQYDRKQEEK